MDVNTEKRAANILLERGVKVSIKAPLFFRLFGKKQMRIVVKAPTLATLINIANESLSIELEETINLKQATQVVSQHGKTMSRIVAHAVINGTVMPFRVRLLAWYLRKHVAVNELFYLYQLIMLYGGYEDFITIIRFTQATRITKPMNLSQDEKRS
jgi:antitoxin component of RelBE/YafQ-DinJ toxin-antitoxin module